jgi:Tol biopolymer transport system component/imidazolonepropionase-like amidohydrolase
MKESPRIPRTTLWAGAFVAALGALAAHDGFAHSTSTQTTVVVTEATNSAVTISPDRRTIIMDVQGVLWSLSSSGGRGTQVTDALLEAARPDFSPRGDLVAFQAYAGGTFHIWVMRPDGAGLRQITTGHGDDREPRFSPNGSKIAFSSDRAFNGSYDIWVVDLASGALTQWTNTGGVTTPPTPASVDEYEPTWSPDGQKIAFVVGSGATGTTIQARDAAGTQTVLATAAPGTRVNAPSYSPDGARVAYLQFGSNKSNLMVNQVKVTTTDDAFPFFPQWLSNDQLLYTADGKIRTTVVSTGATAEIPFEVRLTLNRPPYRHKRFDFDSDDAKQALGIVGPALSPDGRRVAFGALNQIWVMEIGRRPRPITGGLYYKTDPAWSPDGTKIAYASDKSGKTMDLYVIDWRTGVERRVTALDASAEVSPAWSPDGRFLAYQDQSGATFTVEIDTGVVKQVILPLFAPGKPTWHASGKTIAVSALKPYTRRFREGTSQILTVELATGVLTYTEPAKWESFSTRGEDGPVYSPDGTALAAVMHSQLYVIPVDANGVPNGDAQKINHEVTDAPTWSGDSRSLLYLSNGKLRLISRSGGQPHTVSLDLSWRPQQHEGRVTIHAGRLWDGKGPDVLTNVDIVVRDQRIQSIGPHRERRHGEGDGRHHDDSDDDDGRFIDASNQTVVPGIWESHTHQYIEGKFYGDRLGRLWMAYGVTSLQSVGDPAYRAPETREAFAAGARVGPRYFSTGEALDGERVFYNFMRPVTTEQQLQLEFSRAKALDYDMVKTYVRLPHAWQKLAIENAHSALGVFTGGHYMMPQLAEGGDGMTHVSATTRTGWAYTRSSAGISYHDMTDLFRMSAGAFDISTTFNSSLYAEDPTMVDDARLQVLNPAWDQASLVAKRDAAVSTPQTLSLDSLQKEEDTVKRIQLGGGTLLAGTDSPLDNVATALHLNLRAQVRYGLAPWQALQSATLKPARMYNVAKDLGTVEPGKLADLAFINGDPLTDIKQLANVAAVMKGGRYYSTAELMQPFIAPTSAAAVAPQSRIEAPLVHPGPMPWWHDLREMVDGCQRHDD